jgi:hypothetical protein
LLTTKHVAHGNRALQEDGGVVLFPPASAHGDGAIEDLLGEAGGAASAADEPAAKRAKNGAMA